MAKITITGILGSFLSVVGINNRFTQVEDEFNNKVLYRDNPIGEPNEMNNDLDMNDNDVINVGSIKLRDGSSFVQDIESISPNLIVTDDGEGTYTIDAINLGGGNVFNSIDNTYLPGTTQYFPAIEVDGVNVSDQFNTIDTEITDVETIANTANSTANTANSTANSAQSTANTAQSTANSALTSATAANALANTKISQSQGDARYTRNEESLPRMANFRVDASGTGSRLPSGWAVSTLGIGTYLVVHNRNAILYPVITADGVTVDDSYNVHIYQSTANSFRFVTRNITGAPVNLDHYIMVTY